MKCLRVVLQKHRPFELGTNFLRYQSACRLLLSRRQDDVIERRSQECRSRTTWKFAVKFNLCRSSARHKII